jgi:hypothetical protein
MGTLWVESQRGRPQALGALEGARSALALAEPESPGESAGQPLAAAISPVYYRTKAAYVFWMLRDLDGDAALSAALKGTGLSPYMNPSQFEKLLETSGAQGDGSSSLGSASGDHRDLAWFFADWVDADKGLPDLKIDSVFPTAAEAGNWLVAVNVSNSGYAAAQVPVTVRTADSNAVTQRLMVPARGSAVERILILGKPIEVQVNDSTVPETEATIHITKIGDASSAIPPAEPPQGQPK